MLDSVGLHLEEVDIDKAAEANHQLRHPSVRHKGRDTFFKAIENGHTVRTATVKAIPADSIKQSIKIGLIKAGIIKDHQQSGGYSIIVFYDTFP